MLSKEQDRLITDVSPGTPLHSYWKMQWIPALRSERLEKGGVPVPVELLCEKYVAFRDDDGKAGFLLEACPHRGVSLAMGRNENNRLTCIFHGWSFDADGNCTHMPTETDQSICSKVKGQGFPVKEAGGILWVYLGEGEAPKFSDYAFTHLNKEHARPRASYIEANWMQNLETLLDSAHIGLLHKNTTADANLPQNGLQLVTGSDTPEYTLESTAYGLRSYSLRDIGAEQKYLRVTEYVAPGFTFIGTTDAEAGFLIMVVPVNNFRTLQWYVYWDERQPINDNLPDFALLGTDESDDNFCESRQGTPMYGQDREAMKNGSWTGIPGVIFEDYAVAESIPLVDRTKEFLGNGDRAIVRMRRELISRINQAAEGNQDVNQSASYDYRAIRALAVMVDENTDIKAFTDDRVKQRQRSWM